MGERLPATEQHSRTVQNGLASAYDLARCGMGVQLHTVEMLTHRHDLSSWEKDWAFSISSNYLTTDYTESWLSPKNTPIRKYGPLQKCPLSKAHVQLFERTKELFISMDRHILRLFLMGNDGITTMNDPEQPVTIYEMYQLVGLAQKRGLIRFTRDTDDEKIRVPPSTIELKGTLFNANIALSPNYAESLQTVRLCKTIRPQLVQTALYKLGCMLALTDQLTYDARLSQIPISADFKPHDAPLLDATWQLYFGERTPGIGVLYQQAQGVFRQHADPEDPLTQHLYEYAHLPWLAA